MVRDVCVCCDAIYSVCAAVAVAVVVVAICLIERLCGDSIVVGSVEVGWGE